MPALTTPQSPGQSSIPLVDDIAPPDDKAKKTNKGGRPPGSKDSKKRAPKTDAAPRPPSTKASLRQGIANTYGVAGAGLIFVNKNAAQVVIESSEEVADAWMDLCDQSPAVRRFWEQLTTGGAWGAVVTAHVPIILALMPGGNNLLSGLIGGGVSPGRPAATRRGPAAGAPPPPPPPPGAQPPPPAPGDMGADVPFNPAFGEQQVSGVG